jgi:hypothetical protein
MIVQEAKDRITKKKESLLAEIDQLVQEEHRQRYWASRQNFTERGARAEEERQSRWEEKHYNMEQEYIRLGNDDSSQRPISQSAPVTTAPTVPATSPGAGDPPAIQPNLSAPVVPSVPHTSTVESSFESLTIQ